MLLRLSKDALYTEEKMRNPGIQNSFEFRWIARILWILEFGAFPLCLYRMLGRDMYNHLRK